MHKKPYIYFILGLIGFFFLLTIPYGTCTEVSGTIVLEYSEEEAVKIYPKSTVAWSFSGSNPDINITLHSYSESCWLGHSWHRIVSEGHTSDSGSWSVAGHSVCDPDEVNNIPPFYFVFVNTDSDHENTTVTYSLDVDPLGIPGYSGIIIFSSLGMVAALLVVTQKKKCKN